jgi:acyl-CoA thioesterase-1
MGPSRRRVNSGLAGLALSAGLAPLAAGRARGQAPTPVSILCFGDSLTAGYGLAAADSFPARLEAALKAEGVPVSAINAGLSGDTTAGGLARLDWALDPKPDRCILELGANDGLRGLDPGATERNLDAMLSKLKAKGVPTLLAGMLAPPNLGPEYGARFNGLYAALAARHGVLLYPFFLDGVAANPALNLGDGIHPNAKGVAVIVERILPYVKRLVAAAA